MANAPQRTLSNVFINPIIAPGAGQPLPAMMPHNMINTSNFLQGNPWNLLNPFGTSQQFPDAHSLISSPSANSVQDPPDGLNLDSSNTSRYVGILDLEQARLLSVDKSPDLQKVLEKLLKETEERRKRINADTPLETVPKKIRLGADKVFIFNLRNMHYYTIHPSTHHPRDRSHIFLRLEKRALRPIVI
ncbi:hypothetical protein L3Y34_013711 [Caenorhabditis briggsae]|uniref:Uncharacterized protein n=1 Tax=Caenorhabditis briggsae TaxID=6238 RepID=A0AAE9CY77_CAEBR|nr:hypothetical protein L3Y34_013711 [Caenorhabditis briggsae]